MAGYPATLTFPSHDVDTFAAHLQQSHRILALIGAGLSASSGLPTFRGAGGIWRNRDAVDLATPAAFREDPALVWQFYSYRRHMALNAQPNKGHEALVQLSMRNKNFISLSQNVDGLCQRAGHPKEQLKLLHGNLFDIKCSGFDCNYTEKDNFIDPIVPALAIPTDGPQPEPGTTSEGAADNLLGAIGHAIEKKQAQRELDISDEKVPIPEIEARDLPQCPKCKTGLLRPGIVWFGETLPRDLLAEVDHWISEDKIDLMMVIGTSARVYPASGYIDEAVERGARVAVINMDRGDLVPDGGALGLTDQDWFFVGDAAQVLPEILKSVIGEI